MMFDTSVMVGLAMGLVCVFVALAFFISRITSVRNDTEKAIEGLDKRSNERIENFADEYSNLIFNLTKRIQKLEDSKICILDSGTDEVRETSLYAITKVGYSTVIVSLTEDELAVIDSFIDWACLDDDFSAVKLDKNYKAEDWRNNK